MLGAATGRRRNCPEQLIGCEGRCMISRAVPRQPQLHAQRGQLRPQRFDFRLGAHSSRPASDTGSVCGDEFFAAQGILSAPANHLQV